MLVSSDLTCHGSWCLTTCSLWRLWDRSQSSVLAQILNTDISEAAEKNASLEYITKKNQKPRKKQIKQEENERQKL